MTKETDQTKRLKSELSSALSSLATEYPDLVHKIEADIEIVVSAPWKANPVLMRDIYYAGDCTPESRVANALYWSAFSIKVEAEIDPDTSQDQDNELIDKISQYTLQHQRARQILTGSFIGGLIMNHPQLGIPMTRFNANLGRIIFSSLEAGLTAADIVEVTSNRTCLIPFLGTDIPPTP